MSEPKNQINSMLSSYKRAIQRSDNAFKDLNKTRAHTQEKLGSNLKNEVSNISKTIKPKTTLNKLN